MQEISSNVNNEMVESMPIDIKSGVNTGNTILNACLAFKITLVLNFLVLVTLSDICRYKYIYLFILTQPHTYI